MIFLSNFNGSIPFCKEDIKLFPIRQAELTILPIFTALWILSSFVFDLRASRFIRGFGEAHFFSSKLE